MFAAEIHNHFNLDRTTTTAIFSSRTALRCLLNGVILLRESRDRF
jgi:hypothetical protein